MNIEFHTPRVRTIGSAWPNIAEMKIFMVSIQQSKKLANSPRREFYDRE